MSEEECDFGSGLKIEYFGNILKVTDLARISANPTDEVTMIVDTTHLSEAEICAILELAEDAFKGIKEKSNQKEELILNDSSVDSVKFFREVLKIKQLPMMKINLAVSGRLAVKNLGLDSALELLEAKMRHRGAYLFRYPGIATVDCYDLDLFILPGVIPCSHTDNDADRVPREDIESVFRVEDIIQIVSFTTNESSTYILEDYLYSEKHDLEIPSHKISAFAIRAIGKLAETFRNEIKSLTSDQLREFLTLVERCELESYPIKELLTRLKLPRVESPHHSSDCREYLVPCFTIDEIQKLDSEAELSIFASEGSKLFSCHLHSPVDFLLADLATQKGVSRYVEMRNFISKARGPIPGWEEYAPLAYFNRQLDKYLVEVLMTALKDESDDIPLVWLAEINEHQLTDPPPNKYSLS